MLRVVDRDGSQNPLPVEDPLWILKHQKLVDGYMQSHRIRNHSPKTIVQERRFLEGWFESHGPGWRPLFVWEAMKPVEGRKRIVAYGNILLESGVQSATIRSHLGVLSRFFSYVLEHPYLETDKGTIRIQDCHGVIDQPVSEYDMPRHAYNGERLGVPMDPERLYGFYSAVQGHYLGKGGAIRARNYAMMVLAGESGLRADELVHLEVSKDLFFESRKLQTRYAKGSRGSGKKCRMTIFTPLAMDTIRYYLKSHRPGIMNFGATDYLFPSRSGNIMTYTGMHMALQEMVSSARKSGFTVAKHMSWHWMRRLFATRFIERFPDKLPVLVELLGHSSPNTVHRYIRHSEAWMDRKIQEVLEGGMTWPSAGD